MAKASNVTIAEVEEIVELGQLDPDEIHLPGIYVDRVVKGEKYEKKIEVISPNSINLIVVTVIIFHVRYIT